MRSFNRIVLLTLVSVLSLLSGVKSDSKSFPYGPSSITSVSTCAKDSLFVQFVVDAASPPSSSQYLLALQHVNSIATGLLGQSTGSGVRNSIAAGLSVYRSNTVTTVSTGVWTPTAFTTAVNSANSYYSPTSTSNTVNAINSVVTSINANTNFNSYPRRVIYVITGSSPADYSSWYQVSKAVEAVGIEIFIEGVGVNYAQSQQLVNIAADPSINHYINATNYNSLTSTGRAISAVRRDIGGTCSVFSGTNYVTFDGVSYSPATTGYSVLTQTVFAYTDPRMRSFTVVANAGVNDVSITVNADTIRFVWANGQLTTTLDGNQITLGPGTNNVGTDTAINVGLSQLSAGSLGMVVNVTTTSNDFVQLGFYQNPYILITPNYDLYSHTVGLCGTWDSCTSNEFISASGLTAQQAFVSAWSVPSYTYNTALWTSSSGSIYSSTAPTPTSYADQSVSQAACAGVSSYLNKLCSWDVAQNGAAAAAVYFKIQASACESYCQSGVLTQSYVAGCDPLCLQNFPPFDLHNVTSQPIEFFDVQTVNGQQMYAQVYLGGSYVIQATDPAGIVDYTSIQFNCSGELSGISAGSTVSVTRNPQLGFPEVQLKGSGPVLARPTQYSWKALSYPYYGQFDNTTTAAAIAAQAPVIISGTSLTPRFTPILSGVYTFELAAYDGCMIKTSTVSIGAVCDNCDFTARVEPTTTVFYMGSSVNPSAQDGFSTASYQGYIYAAPLYPTPNLLWNVSSFTPYNVRYENITWTATNFPTIYEVILTTGTTGHTTVNTSTLPVPQGVTYSFYDDVAPYLANPITINDQVVIEPVAAVIEKHHHHTLYYAVNSQSVNVVAVPIESFNTEVVCTVYLQPNGLNANVYFYPNVPQVADYCTGKYNISFQTSDVCHNSSDSFLTQVNCNSRPILNAPGCKNKVLQVYDPTPFTGGWKPSILDGTTPYDTEETAFYYNWTLVSYPALSQIGQPTSCTTGSCSITPDTAGNFVYTYTVSDGCRTESATYTLTAQCYNMAGNQLRVIDQVYSPAGDFNYDGSGLQTISFFDNSTLALNVVGETVVFPTDPTLDTLPPFNVQYQNVYNGGNGNFRPTYGGDWSITYSIVDDCGILNQSTFAIRFNCQPATGQSITQQATITVSTSNVQTSTALFPSIQFDGTQSYIRGTAYTAQAQYWWYYRSASSNNVDDYVQINSHNGVINWGPNLVNNLPAGNYQILLIYTDGCIYTTQTTIVSYTCDQAIPAFEIDQILHNFVYINNDIFDIGNKVVNGNFVFYGPNFETALTLNASATVNGTYFQWSVTSGHGDFYSLNTISPYPFSSNTQQPTLYLTFPVMAAGITVQLSVASACPGAVYQNISQTISSTTCDQDWINDPVSGSYISPQRNNFMQGVTFTSDVTSVAFEQSNRFDSVTFTANNVVPQYVYYKKFLVTAAPADSIYAPVVQSEVVSSSNTVYSVGYQNNTDFKGLYNIATTTTDYSTVNTWTWIAIDEVDGNSTYTVCFTPDVPGTYTISAEIRDFCNNTFTKSITITANCPTPVQFSDAQAFSVDSRNFRDLARVTIDASNLNNPANSDLKFRWELSAANGSFANPQSLNGSYYAPVTDSLLTNYYGSVVSFVLPYTTYNNSYNARYDIWDGCQMVSGNVNVTVLATTHRNIFVNSIAAPVPNSTTPIKVQSQDSVLVGSSQYANSVRVNLRTTDCYSSNIVLQVAEFQAYNAPPTPKPPKNNRTGVIVGAVIGSVAGAAIIGAAVFGIMKYKARSVAV